MKFPRIFDVTKKNYGVKFMQLVFVLWCYGTVTNAQNMGKYYKIHLYNTNHTKHQWRESFIGKTGKLT